MSLFQWRGFAITSEIWKIVFFIYCQRTIITILFNLKCVIINNTGQQKKTLTENSQILLILGR